jgi:hypothetical protein
MHANIASDETISGNITGGFIFDFSNLMETTWISKKWIYVILRLKTFVYFISPG